MKIDKPMYGYGFMITFSLSFKSTQFVIRIFCRGEIMMIKASKMRNSFSAPRNKIQKIIAYL